MDSTPQVFISHTTRDRRDHALAHRLAVALRERGILVWIAPDSIPVGNEWEEEIVLGIMEKCSHFLIILSAASVQADWVVREIALAKQRYENDNNLSILALEVGSLPNYPNKEFVNRMQKLPYHDDFSQQMDELLTAIGLQPSASQHLDDLIAEKTSGFVGREYVFAGIESFINNEPNGYFTLLGDPGAGKSAILAEFVRRVGCIAHFNVRGLGLTKVDQFIRNICEQLILRYGLPYPSVPPDAGKDGTFLLRVLNEARSVSSKPIVIAVDALDEVDLSSQEVGANILYLPPVLPTGVYFVLSRRDVELPLMTSVPQILFDLQEYVAETAEDIRQFLNQATNRPKLLSWISAHGYTAEEFRSVLVEKSESNFMYLRYVLPDIENGLYEDISIDTLPHGLTNYYLDHWHRMGMAATPLPTTKIRIVYVLSEARLPINRAMIARFSSTDDSPVSQQEVQSILDEWRQFLHMFAQVNTLYFSIYHTSFRDFLNRREIVQAAGIDLKTINALFADTIFNWVFGDD